MRKLALVALLLLGLLLTACTPKVVDYEQISPKDRLVAKFSHVTAENSTKHLAAMQFAQAAKDRTDGHVEIQVYPNSQLYKDGEELGALQSGAIQFIATVPSKLGQLDPAWEVYDLPYLFTSFHDVEALFASPVGQQMRQRLEARGLVALAIWPNGFKEFTNLRHPLVTPADFKGLTFRVQAGVLQAQFKAVGAKALLSSFDSVYADIENGQVDGQENTLNNIYTRNLQEVQPYLTLSDHGYLSYVVLTQAAWWNTLEPMQRQALQDALGQATDWMRQNAQPMNDQALQRIEATGRVQVRTLTPAERDVLRKAFQPAYQAVADSLGTDFLDQVVAAARSGH